MTFTGDEQFIDQANLIPEEEIDKILTIIKQRLKARGGTITWSATLTDFPMELGNVPPDGFKPLKRTWTIEEGE